jgi:branched-chain amino acid transport system substrate-binding protein
MCVLRQDSVTYMLRFTAKDHPGILLDVCFDDKGDIDRESFLVEVKNGKQEVVATLPMLNKR